MALKAIVDAITSLIPTNADSVYGIKDEKIVSVDEIRGIYNGEMFSIWKKQKYYYLTFHPNSGTGTMPDQIMPCGTVAALPTNLFSRIGYLFQGWNPDADGDAVYTDEQKVTDIAGAGETLTLYAIWKAITWYVRFNANGGTGSMANQAHAYDEEQALTKNAFSRENHTFLGWGTTSAGKEVFLDEAEVKNLKSTHGATLNLYAVWQHNGYYAIQYGKLVNCPNAATEQLGGHSNSSGAITIGYTAAYGAYGHTNDSDSHDDYWGAYTGNLNTYGCKKLTFTYTTFEWVSGAESRYYEVYGDGTLIKSANIYPGGLANEKYTQEVSVDISDYATVAVRVRIKDGNYSNSNNYTNAWMGAGFVDVRIHN